MTRLLPALLLCLLFIGCPAPKPSPTASSEASPTPESAPAVSEATPPEAPVPHPPSPTPEPAPAAMDFVGVWTTTDDQGQVFDISVFPNGQVVTNWTKGKDKAFGERGLWRRFGGRLVAFYHDGSSDVMEASVEGVRYAGYGAEVPLDRPPLHETQAKRLDGAEAKFVGIWRLNREPDGSYQYLALQSNGRAFSSVNGGTEGKWAVVGNAAECTWPDGWVDRLELTNDGWQKRSSIGGDTETPADLSPAVRVGEARFEMTP